MEHAVDPAGRLFVDRDPDMFRCLLQFMRAATMPPQIYIKTNKESLLEECLFFALDHMTHRIKGITSIYDLRPRDRHLFKEESEEIQCGQADGWHQNFLLDVFKEDTSPLDPIDLGWPLLKPGLKERPQMACHTLAAFEESFQRLSGGVFNLIKQIKGITIAGGSIVSTLTNRTNGATSDIDIFLVATIEDAPAILENIYEAIKMADEHVGKKGMRMLVTRSKHAVLGSSL